MEWQPIGLYVNAVIQLQGRGITRHNAQTSHHLFVVYQPRHNVQYADSNGFDIERLTRSFIEVMCQQTTICLACLGHTYFRNQSNPKVGVLYNNPKP